jgi:hypothetical protein
LPDAVQAWKGQVQILAQSYETASTSRVQQERKQSSAISKSQDKIRNARMTGQAAVPEALVISRSAPRNRERMARMMKRIMNATNSRAAITIAVLM